MKKFFSFIIFILIFYYTNAQLDTIGLPIITNYSPREFHGHNQNWNAIQDDDGVMYFANGKGVLVFDGVNWDFVRLTNSKTPRCLYKSENGRIYVGGDDIFGYLSVDSIGRIKFIDLSYKIPKEFQDYMIILKIFGDEENIYLLSNKYFFVVSENETKTFKGKKAFNKSIIAGKNIYIKDGRDIYKFEKDSLIKIPFDEIILDFLIKNDTVFLVSLEKNIYYFDKNNNIIKYSKINLDFSNSTFINVYIYKDKYLIFNSLNNGLLITDFYGKEKFYYKKEQGIISNSTYSVFVDNNENLWVNTSSGISYIELNSPIRLIDNRFGFEYTNILFFNTFKDYLYSCTGFKLYEIILKHTNKTVFVEQVEHSGQNWNSIEINNELYICSNPGIIRIDKNKNIKSYGLNSNVWKIIKVPNKENDYLVGAMDGLYFYKYDGDSLIFQKNISNFNYSARELLFDSKGNLWVGVSSNGVYKIKLTENYDIGEIYVYDATKGLTSTNSIIFFEWNNKILISTYQNLFVYNKAKDTIELFEPITKNYNITNKKVLQLLEIDKNNIFWFEYLNDFFDIEVIAYKYENDKFIEYNPFIRRLTNFSISIIKYYSENYTVVASTKGFVFVNMNKQIELKPYNAYIRKIVNLNNDSILYGGHTLENETKIIRKNLKQKKINISYKNNDIRFYYATPYFIEPKYTLYRVKLENHDKNWSLWSRETKKDYTNLSPGNYIFLVEAKNIYNQISETTKIKILIKYPWYRTIYAYIFYWLIFMGFFWLTVKLVTYRLKRKNEKLEAIVEERTKEIKLKNSELEQQKEEIMTQAEELFIVNTELEKLSTIVRETDNAIILADKNGNFIWINQAFTKIFGYTFEELVNNISTNIIADRTDKNIKDTVNKCLTDKVTVEYELKIKNKSGKDIWIHTTLTPLLDEDGEITSLVAIDSDISILKEAQKQITEQNEYIKSSIKYALTIQKSILPSEKEISDFFDNFIIFKPKDIVSGDFYWISNLFVTDKCRLTHDTTEPISFKVGNTLFFAVVDCTGHGVSGAFMSLIGNRLLAELINERRIDSPKDILYKLDTKLGAVLKRNNKSNHDSMVLSICRFDKYLENDTEFVKVTSAGAKQHFTYFSRQLKEFVRIRGSVRQIGFVVNESLIYDNSEFVLQKGDTLFLYTDGLKDLNNSERKSFGHSRIIDILKESINKPMPEIGDILEVSLNEWLGTELQRDDVTFVGLRMK